VDMKANEVRWTVKTAFGKYRASLKYTFQLLLVFSTWNRWISSMYRSFLRTSNDAFIIGKRYLLYCRSNNISIREREHVTTFRTKEEEK
jgi:hypothetical protein